MKLICSVVVSALIGISASASAGEPVRLDDSALNQVTAGSVSSGLTSNAYTTGSLMIFGRSGTLLERSFARTTATDDGLKGEASATVQMDISGPGLIQGSGGAGVLFTSGFNGT
jgi:hypothetical protein